MLDLGLAGFVGGLLALGMRRPFLWVLAYLYIDIVAPQKISYFILASIPISLIVFVLAFGGWLALDDKRESRLTMRQGILFVFLCYCGYTTLVAEFPEPAALKWAWVWKGMVFALFLPFTLRTRLRIEAAVLFLVLSVSAIVINGGIKTVGGGGGYAQLRLLVDDNTGLYEGSTISMVAISTIPLIIWLVNHGTVFPKDWRVKLFALGLVFASALIPIGTQTRTGLLCLGVLVVLSLRSVRRRFLYVSLIGAIALAATPLLPKSYTDRMSTIENHKSDQSASTRLAVWAWTLDYVKSHPFGGGFDSYLANSVKIETTQAEGSGATTAVESTVIYDKSRAFHSAYFEVLGEQGWPGLVLWLWLHLSGLWQMERIRRRWKNREGPDEQWQAPLANALQQAQIVFLVGGAFVGIGYQPLILVMVAIQCGLWTYLRRIEADRAGPQFARRPARQVAGA